MTSSMLSPPWLTLSLWLVKAVRPPAMRSGSVSMGRPGTPSHTVPSEGDASRGSGWDSRMSRLPADSGMVPSELFPVPKHSMVAVISRDPGLEPGCVSTGDEVVEEAIACPDVKVGK